MPKSKSTTTSEPVSSGREKTPICEMSADRKREVVALLTDDVLAKLTSAFFEVVSGERWGKRDLAAISGINETAIGHILAGRRKNVTVETIALLARAMEKRPELVLHDVRPKGNEWRRLAFATDRSPPSHVEAEIPALSTTRIPSADVSSTGVAQQEPERGPQKRSFDPAQLNGSLTQSELKILPLRAPSNIPHLEPRLNSPPTSASMPTHSMNNLLGQKFAEKQEHRS
jgi:DNA-binding Xre family transcriptional regulator